MALNFLNPILRSSDSIRIGFPDNETEGRDELLFFVEVTVQADDFLTFTDSLGLPVTFRALKHSVHIAAGVLDPETVDMHVRGKLDANFDDGNNGLLTRRRRDVKIELFEGIRIAAMSRVESLTAHLIGEVKLYVPKRLPVGADSLQLNLLAQIPVLN